MPEIITVTANWNTGSLSSRVISRQYDNNRYRIQFMGYPEDTEDLLFYLLVWMRTDESPNGGMLAPIQMDSDQWTISNYFTQLEQHIQFQLCIQNESGTFEAHSPIFNGVISDSLEHDGTVQDVDVTELFDAYREYINQLVVAAGAVVIDPTLSVQGAAADAKAVGDELAGINGHLVSLQETSDYNFEKVAGTIYLPVDVTEESTILEITTNTSKFSASSNARALIVPILPGKTITVTKVLSSRFKLATCVDYPAVGGDITNFVLSSNTQATLTKLTITAGENDHYLFIYYYLMPEGEQSNTEADVKASIKAFYGEAETESPILTDANAYTDERMESLNTGDQLNDMMNLMQAVNLTEANSNIFEDESVINSVINSSGKIAAASTTKSAFIPIKGNSIVTVTATTKCNRFIIATTAELPANGVSVLSTATPGGSIRTYTFVTPGEAKYLFIVYWNSSSSYTEDEARADISVIYGTVAGTGYADRLHNPNISSMLMLNDQMLNLLSVRQLGSLKKGYVCLSADDGRYPLATYVLPTLSAFATQYGKPIPLTMGLADVTPAFDVCNNAEYIATVKNSLDNYDCSIGIHGLTMFTGYTREALYNYFVAQNEKLHTMFGHYPSSVLYVSHGINTQVRAIAGSFYGVCGSIPTGAGTDVSEFGNTNRANVYAMKRFSLLNTGLTMQNLYDAVDHALANHEILCPYWHDINFEEDTSGVVSGQAAKDRFEAFIEYCMSKNVDFINFGDIPMLEVNT